MIDVYDGILTLANTRNITNTRCEVNITRKWYVASSAIVLNSLEVGTSLMLDRTTR